jgi:hypothetical protein
MMASEQKQGGLQIYNLICMYKVYLVDYIISLHLAAYFVLELPS